MEQNVKIKKWQSGVTFGELLAVAVVVIGACLMFWKSTDVRLSALEIRMQTKEQSDANISNKLDKLQDGINDVKISLQNKQDRK